MAGALAGDEAAQAACGGLCADWQTLTGLHAALAVAGTDLAEAIDEHTGIVYPCLRLRRPHLDK